MDVCSASRESVGVRMSELEQMGKTLMETALNFTHPRFEATYPEWSTVSNIGEELVRMSQPIELNKNQQIVLEWLKDRMNVSDITNSLWLLLDDALEVDYDTDGSEAWNRSPIDQKFQVLAAFAEWGKDEVAE